jgi:hypothetical protein
MPSDAVLSEIDEQYEGSAAGTGVVPTGYLFTWKHSNPAANQADAIRVGIQDYRVTTTTCTGGYKIVDNPPLKPISICQGWTTTTTNSPNVSYYSRMRRSFGSARHLLSLGQQSIPASQAETALPSGTTVANYYPGTWAGQYNDATNSVATPAWVFETTNGVFYYVDAYAGTLLGSTTSSG